MQGFTGNLQARFPEEAQALETFAGIEIRFFPPQATFMAILDGKIVSRNSIQAIRKAIGEAGKEQAPITGFTLEGSGWPRGVAERLADGAKSVQVASFNKPRSKNDPAKLFDPKEREISGTVYEWDEAALADLESLGARATDLLRDFQQIEKRLRKLTPERIRELRSPKEPRP